MAGVNCVIAVAVLLAVHVAGTAIPYTPIIQSVLPNRGSIAGGTQIFITGAGFARNGVDGAFVSIHMKIRFIEYHHDVITLDYR